ncbi:hypothetical protein AAG906_039673 [Vitis piasezkii]
MDVKTTFLNGDLSEEVYMSQPQGFEANGKENMNKFDQCVYMKVNESKYIFMVLYIDDILLASSDVNLLNDTKRILSANFNMKDLGEASFVLDSICRRAKLMMYVVKGDKLSNEQCPKNDLEKDVMKTIPYASVVSNLMYAQYVRDLISPSLLMFLKVMRYVQRTKDFMLVYRRMDNLEVVGYSDSDFGGCSDDRKSTSGYIFMLAGGAISWKSVKQSLIASLTMYVEFVACYGASSQAVWLRNLISELQVVDSIFRPIVIIM